MDELRAMSEELSRRAPLDITPQLVREAAKDARRIRPARRRAGLSPGPA